MNRNPVVWFEIYVNDMDRAKKFYENTFDVKLEDISSPGIEMWSFPGEGMSSYGTHGSLVKMEGISAGKNSVIIYFTCDDCSVEEKKVEQFGGKICKSKFSIGEYGFISLVTDTEGNTIGLHSMK